MHTKSLTVNNFQMLDELILNHGLNFWLEWVDESG
jgi:hypothetical protein